jgi:hypothetical protein
MPSTTYDQLTTQIADRLAAGLQRIESVVAVSTEKASAIVAKGPNLPKLPLTDKLPAPQEIVQANFTLLERLLNAQKHYALRILEATHQPADVPAPAATRSRKPSA